MKMNSGGFAVVAVGGEVSTSIGSIRCPNVDASESGEAASSDRARARLRLALLPGRHALLSGLST